MSSLLEKDLESAKDLETNATATHDGYTLSSAYAPSQQQPILIRYLPASYQHDASYYVNRFYYYWNRPIPLPARIERGRLSLEQWWSHPLPSSVPAPLDERFQRWWLAPEHVWKRRRLRIVLWWILLYFVLLFCAAGPDLLPPEARREVERIWKEKVGTEGCGGLGCVKATWETGRAVING